MNQLEITQVGNELIGEASRLTLHEERYDFYRHLEAEAEALGGDESMPLGWVAEAILEGWELSYEEIVSPFAPQYDKWRKNAPLLLASVHLAMNAVISIDDDLFPRERERMFVLASAFANTLSVKDAERLLSRLIYGDEAVANKTIQFLEKLEAELSELYEMAAYLSYYEIDPDLYPRDQHGLIAFLHTIAKEPEEYPMTILSSGAKKEVAS